MSSAAAKKLKRFAAPDKMVTANFVTVCYLSMNDIADKLFNTRTAYSAVGASNFSVTASTRSTIGN